MAPKSNLRVDVPDPSQASMAESEVPESDVVALAGPAAVEVEDTGAPPKRSAFTPRGLLDRTAGLIGLGRTPKGGPLEEKRMSVNPLSLAAADASFVTEQQQAEAAEQVRPKECVSHQGCAMHAGGKRQHTGALVGAVVVMLPLPPGWSRCCARQHPPPKL